MRSPIRSSALVGVLLIAAITTAHAAAAHTASAQGVVSTYYSALNAALRSGTFAAVTAIYAPNATLTQSTPLGVTKVFQGRAAIAAYYKGLYARAARLRFSLVGTQRDLSPSIAFLYEKARTPSMTVPALCTHLFIVQDGLIATDDWVTYFAGK